MEQNITAIGLNPGDLVGTPEELRDQAGLARSTVSEAVRLLRERGILEIRPCRSGGLFVADPNLVIRLRHTLLTVRDAPASVLDAIALHEALEELVSRDAARGRTPDVASALRKLLGRMVRAVDDSEMFMRANWALHEQIAEMCTHKMASAIYNGTLGYISASSSKIAAEEAGAAAHWCSRFRVHEDPVNAITDGGNADVIDALRRHNSPN